MSSGSIAGGSSSSVSDRKGMLLEKEDSESLVRTSNEASHNAKKRALPLDEKESPAVTHKKTKLNEYADVKTSGPDMTKPSLEKYKEKDKKHKKAKKAKQKKSKKTKKKKKKKKKKKSKKRRDSTSSSSSSSSSSDSEEEVRYSAISGHRIKLKIKKSKSEKADDLNRQAMRQYLNSM